MYRITALVFAFIFAGCIGFTGVAAYAQSGIDPLFDLTTLGGASGASMGEITGNITEQIMGSTGPTEQQTSAIDAGSLAVEVAVPEVNQTVIEVIDTRGRYSPRLKVNYREFPLRSLAAKNGRTIEKKTHVEIVTQRIQSRLRVPNIELVVEDRTAILSGTVATKRQRDLAESMLRFEPGIDAVRNNLTVVP